MTHRLARAFSRALVLHRNEHLRARSVSRAGLPDVRSINLQDLLHLHGNASTSVVLMVMAAACLMPVGGIGTVLSFAIALLGWRWAQSRETQELPERLGSVRLSERWTERLLRGFTWVYRVAGRYLRPRLQSLFHHSTRPWWALWIGAMAVLIFLPIPFGNVLPSVSLMLLSLGWMFRDGAALLLAKLVGVGAVVFAVSFGHIVLETLQRITTWVAA